MSRDHNSAVSISSTSSSINDPFSPLSNDHAHSKGRGQLVANADNLDYGGGTGSSQSTEDEASWI